MIKTSFPTTVGDNGTRYVFFSSLLNPNYQRNYRTAYIAKKTGWMGQSYLNQTIVDKEGNHISAIIDKMSTVTEKIKRVADAEYQKEIAYINAMMKKIDTSIFNIALPQSPENDWSSFITLLNFAKTQSPVFFRDVKEELNRIEANIKQQEEVKKKYAGKKKGRQYETESRAYIRTKQYQVTEYMNSLINQMFGLKRGNQNSYANIIKNYIVKTYWNFFLQQSGGRFAFDEESFNSLIIASVQLIIQKLVMENEIKMTEIFGEKGDIESRTLSFEQWISKEENKELAGITSLENIFNSPFAAKMIITNFKNKINLKSKNISQDEKKKIARSRGRKDKKIANQINTNNQALKNQLSIFLTSGKWMKVRSELSQPSGNWLFTEMQELIPIKNGELGVALGSSSVKVDNFFIQSDIEIDEAFFKRWEKKTQDAFSDTFNSLIDTDEENTSTKNWVERQKKIKEYKEELSKILKEEKNIKDLSESFIIESSDKIYESYGAKHFSFDGGSFGGNLTSQLEKIDALASTGGVSLGDLNWLRSAIINSHPNTVIGTSLKQTLKDYLSAIACAILFDDGTETMEQVALNTEQSAVSSTSINTIHLFYLQGFGYYPLSQVIMGVYNKLANVLPELESYGKGGGVKVNIKLKDYPKDETPYENLTLEDWQDVGSRAEAGALLEITFLGKFLDVLNGLANPGN